MIKFLLFCLTCGLWASSVDSSCRRPSVPGNVVLSPRKRKYRELQQVRYSCQRGFNLVANPRRQRCLLGRWRPSMRTGPRCSDVNECNNNKPCSPNARCINRPGSYVCRCKAGFRGNGRRCSNVNECTSSKPLCHVNATCQDTVGSYNCLCDAGFTGNGKTCQDVNECEVGGVCDENAICTNTIGSFQCQCKGGYAGDGITCQRTQCPDLQVENGYLNNYNFRAGRASPPYYPGKRVRVRCNNHYSFNLQRGGRPSLRCKNNGKWDAKPWKCVGSCFNFCFSRRPVPSNYPCGCEPSCKSNGSCCRDYARACERPTPPPPTFTTPSNCLPCLPCTRLPCPPRPTPPCSGPRCAIRKCPPCLPSLCRECPPCRNPCPFVTPPPLCPRPPCRFPICPPCPYCPSCSKPPCRCPFP